MIFKKKSQTLFFFRFLQKILGVALGGLEMGQYWDSTETVLRQYWEDYWGSTEAVLRQYWDSTGTVLGGMGITKKSSVFMHETYAF